MNKFLLKLTTLLLVFAGIASSCNPEPEKYPKDIPFAEYSLLDTDCQWGNLPYDEKVLIINSSEELGKYISCTESSYPIVDFSKYTLLLVSGKTTSGIIKVIANKLQQLSENKYHLGIDIDLFDNNNNNWSIGLLAAKLQGQNHVEIKVVLLHSQYEPCNCIMDTLRGEWSWVKMFGGFIEDTNNEFKSIIKILNQNEDASINYEIFVEDTLFCKDSFHILTNHSYCRKTDIILPHGGSFNTGPKDGYWCLTYFSHPENMEFLSFGDNYFEGNYYRYQKNR